MWVESETLKIWILGINLGPEIPSSYMVHRSRSPNGAMEGKKDQVGRALRSAFFDEEWKDDDEGRSSSRSPRAACRCLERKVGGKKLALY